MLYMEWSITVFTSDNYWGVYTVNVIDQEFCHSPEKVKWRLITFKVLVPFSFNKDDKFLSFFFHLFDTNSAMWHKAVDKQRKKPHLLSTKKGKFEYISVQCLFISN